MIVTPLETLRERFHRDYRVELPTLYYEILLIWISESRVIVDETGNSITVETLQELLGPLLHVGKRRISRVRQTKEYHTVLEEMLRVIGLKHQLTYSCHIPAPLRPQLRQFRSGRVWYNPVFRDKLQELLNLSNESAGEPSGMQYERMQVLLMECGKL
ncbi:MAG: hypothetical protein RR202_06065 [Bacteroidales bacterium]